MAFAERRREEFADHDLSNVTLQHQNVCKDGFPNATGVEGGMSIEYRMSS